MYRDKVGARLDEIVDIARRVGDHQVYVERQAGIAAYRLYDFGSEAYVRHEHAVHYVEVQKVRARNLGAFGFAAEVREVGGEN